VDRGKEGVEDVGDDRDDGQGGSSNGVCWVVGAG